MCATDLPSRSEQLGGSNGTAPQPAEKRGGGNIMLLKATAPKTALLNEGTYPSALKSVTGLPDKENPKKVALGFGIPGQRMRGGRVLPGALGRGKAAPQRRGNAPWSRTDGRRSPGRLRFRSTNRQTLPGRGHAQGCCWWQNRSCRQRGPACREGTSITGRCAGKGVTGLRVGSRLMRGPASSPI